jgi:hypothetical protein
MYEAQEPQEYERNIYLYLIIKGARVSWFGSSVRHFTKKTSIV